MNITEEEIAKFKAAKTEDEWNALCEEVKSARGGNYPADWWERMKLSGIIDEAAARFW